MDVILKYFPGISEVQKKQFDLLQSLYAEWNEKINVISRKDIENLYVNHVLHSLGIAKVVTFKPNTQILDVGTGGGFPGIPLAILFPEVSFHLVDSIGKKIKVVNEVKEALGLENVLAEHKRAETLRKHYDFIISRAVTQLPEFMSWVDNKISKTNCHYLKNGILYLKGGDVKEELKGVKKFKNKIYPLPKYFSEDFFETKQVVHLWR